MLVCILIALLPLYSNSIFPPPIFNYNDYGPKIAMNDLFLVKVQNNNYLPTFFIQFSPYNSTSSSLQCSTTPPNMTNHYVYSVILGKNQTQFFFAGELVHEQNGTFIGVAKYDSRAPTCESSFRYSIQYFFNYKHQEYYVIGAERSSRLVYGFSNEFIYIYDSANNSIRNLWNGNLTWPDHSFMPHAIDVTDSFGIITGFIRNPIDTISKYIPIIYLINFNSSNNNPIIVDTYLPNATAGTWQDKLTNSDANFYSEKYDMSVSIDQRGNVLVGMQFISRVFLFSVNLIRPDRLDFTSRHTNGRSVGNGKALTWLDNGIAAILVNSYTLSYRWSLSKIYFYDIVNHTYNRSSIPLSIFPNNHQLLPTRFSPILVYIVSSPSSLAVLDNQGNILVIDPTPPGFYPAFNNMGSTLVSTSPRPCLAGTYKNQMGVHDCIVCPNGTKNPGNASLECIPCGPNTFCSLGSVDDPSRLALETVGQILAYPKSPENTIFDEILIQNMFTIGSGHCLRVSPSFWTSIVAGLAIIIIIIMGILKICIEHRRSFKFRNRLKRIFKHTDLINGGQFWIGGLASFCVIILVSFTYAFSSQFLQQYPAENSSGIHFACDRSLRNAKFETTIQSSSIPANENAQKMIDLLNVQSLLLNVEFVNTKMNCDVISLRALYGTRWSPARWLDCHYNHSILFLTIELNFQQISIQIFLEDIQTIGALRVGLDGAGDESEHYNRRKLHFFQAFAKDNHVLAQSLPITLELTKVINETLPLVGEESHFSGIYVPTFTIDFNTLFLSNDQYILSNSTRTIFTIDIHETSYFVKNLQSPIAKSSEIIFHNLLFTMVCLGIFGLGFLLYKLVIKPICSLLFPRHFLKKRIHRT